MKKQTKRRSLLALVSLLIVACMTLLAFPAYATGTGDEGWSVWDGSIDRTFSGDGTANSPYLITSAAELAGLAANVIDNDITTLKLIAQNHKRDAGAWSRDHDNDSTTANIRVSKYYKLTVNIDLNNLEWIPIGTGTYRFEGIFDGDGHTVKNLKVSEKTFTQADEAKYGQVYTYNAETDTKTYINTKDDVGLFGTITSTVKNDFNVATVKNLTIDGAVLSGTASIAPLVARGFNTTTISNCHVVNTVINVTKASYVGGLVAYGGVASDTQCLTIEDCTTDVDINATCAASIGGVLGARSGSLVIRNCISKGDITVNNTSNKFQVGGFVGSVALGVANTDRLISGCIYTGNINVTTTSSGSDIRVGGIAGAYMNGARIDKCAMYGTVTLNCSATATHRSGLFVGCYGMGQNGAANASTITDSICLAPTGTTLGDNADDTGSVLKAIGASNNTCDYTGITILATAKDPDIAMSLYGTQTTAPADFDHDNNADTPAVKANDVRFVATLGDANNNDDAVLADYSSVGFVITAIYGTEIQDFSKDVNHVYRSIKANGVDKAASELGGDYLVAITGENIPADTTDTVTFYVTPKLVSADGNTTTYGATAKLVFVGGAYQTPAA